MLVSPPGGPAGPPEDPEDDAADRLAAAAPADAVKAVVAALDRASDGACDAGDPARAVRGWEELVRSLQVAASELAARDTAVWRTAVGSAVPLEHWLSGTWAPRLREALLADGFTPVAAERALRVVAVQLQCTCPLGDGAPAGGGPLTAYPVLSRLRPRLSQEAPDDAAASADALLARLVALRG